MYNGSFAGDETGVYIANVSINSNGETVKNISSGIIIPYSPEYAKIAKSEDDLLERLAIEGGGRVLNNGDEVFKGELKQTVGINDMTNILLILIIILLMLDIALRRLNITFEKLEPVMNKIAGTSAALADLLVKPFIRERKLVGIEPKSEKAQEKVQKPDVQEKKDSADKEKKDTVKDGHTITSYLSNLSFSSCSLIYFKKSFFIYITHCCNVIPSCQKCLFPDFCRYSGCLSKSISALLPLF